MAILSNKSNGFVEGRNRFMSTNDYVKYLTETFIKHFELPKEERKQLKLDKKSAREPALTHWFGLLPLSISMLLKRRG